MFKLTKYNQPQWILLITTVLCSLYKYLTYNNLHGRNYNKTVNKTIITVPPGEIYIIKLNTTFRLIPITGYANYNNFYGIKINEDLYLYDQKCQSLFKPGTRVEIINTFSDSEIIMCCFFVEHFTDV